MRLGERKAKWAVPQLISALEDENQYVRGWSAWALGEIKDPEGVEPLIQALEKHLKMAESDRLEEQTKCIPDLYVALEAITGKKYGMDVKKWKEFKAKEADRRK